MIYLMLLQQLTEPTLNPEEGISTSKDMTCHKNVVGKNCHNECCNEQVSEPIGVSFCSRTAVEAYATVGLERLRRSLQERMHYR